MKFPILLVLFAIPFTLLALSDDVWKDIVESVKSITLALIAPFAAWVIWYLNKMSKVGNKSHDLANSFMLEQKRKYAVKCQEFADLTKKPEDVLIATEAEDAYQAHKKTDAAMKVIYPEVAKV